MVFPDIIVFIISTEELQRNYQHARRTNNHNHLKMQHNVSHKSKVPLIKPITSTTSKKIRDTRKECLDQDHGDFELQDFSRKGGKEKHTGQEEPHYHNQDQAHHQGVQNGKKIHGVDELDEGNGIDKNIEDFTSSRALVVENETNTEQLNAGHLPVDKDHNLSAVENPRDSRPFSHTQNTPRRRLNPHILQEAPARIDRKSISEQVRQIRAETRSILEETRRFLEGSDNEDAEYPQQASMESMKRAEIRKIRAETRAIREETSVVKAEIRSLVNAKLSLKQRKERHIRYSI